MTIHPWLLTSAAVLLSAGLVGCTPASGGGRQNPGLSAGDEFALRFEQGGRVVPAAGGQVALRARPFEVTVAMRQLGGVLVHASFDPAMHNAARRGADLSKVAGFDQVVRAPQGGLLVDPKAWDYWYAMSPTVRRKFTELREVRHKGALVMVVAKAPINRLLDARHGEVPLTRLGRRPLFLTVVSTAWQGGRRVETQRQSVAISFAPDGPTTSTGGR